MLNKLRRLMWKSSRVLGDVNAVRRGRVGQRVANRAIGRTTNKLTRKLWR